MLKTLKALLFALLACALLAIGYIGAQALWHSTHGRYDMPNTGYYHSSVSAVFNGIDDEIYSFHFQGQTEPRWRWVYSTNLFYRRLHFEWRGYSSQAEPLEGNGTLSLPSLAYESSHGTGILTRVTLAEWLLGTTNADPAATKSVDAVFGFIKAAGHGSLPAPNHHGHSFEQPVNGRIQHFLLGYGVGGFVYIWIGLWLLLVTLVGRRFWKKHC